MQLAKQKKVQMLEVEATICETLKDQNVLEVTCNPPVRINHLESVLYSQVKDYREKEDLEVNRWKVLYSLEDFLALALNY